jgi:hypothetical protein
VFDWVLTLVLIKVKSCLLTAAQATVRLWTPDVHKVYDRKEIILDPEQRILFCCTRQFTWRLHSRVVTFPWLVMAWFVRRYDTIAVQKVFFSAIFSQFLHAPDGSTVRTTSNCFLFYYHCQYQYERGGWTSRPMHCDQLCLTICFTTPDFWQSTVSYITKINHSCLVS